MDAETTPIERLEAASLEVAALAARIAGRAQASGEVPAARTRVRLVQERLRLAADELDRVPGEDEGITDE
jgi:hypothetical protein